MTYIASPEAPVHALLTDGTTVQIRHAEPEDSPHLLRLYDGLSVENLRFHFFATSRRSGRQAVERACRPAREGVATLVAVHTGTPIGVAGYEKVSDDPALAEIAVTVADGFHHRGVGTLLLEHLVHAARAEGITGFTAAALADNHEILKVFADLGLRTTRRFVDGTVHCTVALDPDQDYVRAVEERGRVADAASLEPLLAPRSLVVVGAGRRPGSASRAVLKNLRRAGFTGRLMAVSPHAHAIEHVPCHPSVTALPDTPDLAVLAVPAPEVADTAEECGKAGIRAVAVLTTGLDDTQIAALLDTCRRYGMRLAGPDCLGIANTDDAVRMDATFAVHRPLPGSAGVAVQSGGVGIALLGGLTRLGIGVSTFVSLGDKHDVSGNDLLQWWESDGRTDLAVLHLESFGNPQAFSRTARRIARRMPVLTVDAGRSEAGQWAAGSHTAAAATPTLTRQALFTQAGVTATRSITELLDAAALLHSQPLPAGARVAVVSNAGGAAVLAADACADAGLVVPELPAELVDELLRVLPPGASAVNPVDATATVGEAALRACVERLEGHGAVDAVLVVLVPTALSEATGDNPARALVPRIGRRRTRPLLAVLPEQATSVTLLPGAGGRVPAYADPRAAARALAHAAARARWLARQAGTVPETPGIHRGAARAMVDRFLDEYPEGGWLDPRQCAQLLHHYRIPYLPWAWAESEEEAVTAAERLSGAGGGRVALKGFWPGLVHKSEQGAVLLDVAGDSQVRAGHRDLAARFGEAMTGVLVQPMAARGTELVAGMVNDEVFGPLVLFGLGGTATELLADHAARLAPLTDNDVHDLITAPRCAPLLFGHCGAGPVDLAGLEEMLHRLSAMACDLPQLAEADLNPVVARPDGVTALDVRLRVLPRRERDPYLRRLR